MTRRGQFTGHKWDPALSEIFLIYFYATIKT